MADSGRFAGERDVGPRPPGLRSSSYRLYVITRMMSTLAMTSVKTVVAWMLYDISGNPFYLGLAGLVLFLPSLLLMLISGVVIDRLDRRRVLAGSYLVMAICALALAALAWSDELNPAAILGMLALLGIGRAFYLPTVKVLLINLVEGRVLPHAIAVNSSLMKIAVVSGPIIGGILYTISPVLTFAATGIIFVFSASTAMFLRGSNQMAPNNAAKASDFLAGLHAIRNDNTLLGTITLDFFVMFMGGVTAFLPIFAKDVLGTDAAGLGVLRSAPAVAGILMAAWLSRFPIRRHAGSTMLFSVAVYGFTVLIFGLSTNYWISFLALLIGGAVDMVGFNIRESLIQLRTSDHLRGRVTAVNTVVVGASNDLGEFRAGTLALFVGAVPTVLFGGVAALAVTAAWFHYFPQLRRLDQLA